MKRTIAFLGLLGAVAMTAPAMQDWKPTDSQSASMSQPVALTAQVGLFRRDRCSKIRRGRFVCTMFVEFVFLRER